MNEKQKTILLNVAKAAVERAVTGKPVGKPSTEEAGLLTEQGCFVTLKSGDELRGCIGQFVADRPLIQMVSQMAVSSCLHDPRFGGSRIQPEELPGLDIEISVLSPLVRTDNPLSLKLGQEGIYITDGKRSGCFLPQVATEAGWSAEEFLSCCCAHKAGMRADAWKDPKVEVYLFTADVFGAGWDEI